MRLSNSQLQTLEERTYARALTDGLSAFEADTRDADPVLADQIATYRDHGDRSIFSRIVELTDNADYQRGLLALTLQSDIDFTTRSEFHYIMRQPALSGNVKARHVILMIMAMHRATEGTP